MRSDRAKPLRSKKVAFVTAALFAGLAAFTAITAPLSSEPPAPWPAQHVIYPHYPAPVSAAAGSPSEILGDLDPTVLERTLGEVEIGRGDAYEELIAGDNPAAFWRLGQTWGTAPPQVITDGAHSAGVDIERDAGTENIFSTYTDTGAYSTLSAPSHSKVLTVEAWVRNHSLNRRSIPLSKGFGRTEDDSSWWVEWRPDNKLAFGLWTERGGFKQALSASAYDAYWHHVVGTYDGTWLSLYVDGALAGRSRHGGNVSNTPAPITVGNVASHPDATAFRGSVDEVAIYQRALPPSSVEKHYFAAATTLRKFSADTIFWELLPSSWKSRAEWQLSFPEGASISAVFAGGREVAPTSENLEHTYLAVDLPDSERTYDVPNGLVGAQTPVVVAGRGLPPPPTMTFHMLRAGDPTVDASVEAEPPTSAWWERNLVVSIGIAIALYVLLAALMVWSLRQLRLLNLTRAQWWVFIIVVVLETALAAFSTNLDLQIFKGVAERYWILEPIRGLTLSGYGPVMDALFVLPMLPYLVVADLLGTSSEFGLNLAMRLPMLVGTLFLVAAAARLVGILRVRPTATKWIFYGLVLNPVVVLWSLWHPESLVVGLLVLSVALMMEYRYILAGLTYGVSVTSKYWPLFVGPLILLFLWRESSRRAAMQWLLAGAGATALLSVVYWAPTFSALSSLDEAGRLLTQRLPYFGGSDASSYSTIWSLYGIPRELLQSQGWQDIITRVEGASFFITVAVLGVVIGLFAAGGASFNRFAVAAAAVLTVVAGVNSLSVVGFALWSLPFLLIGCAELSRRRLILAIGAGAWCAGVLVAFVVEPVSYWLLHANEALDDFALQAASWLNDSVVNPELARAFGFIFCLLMTLISLILITELAISGRFAQWLRSAGGGFMRAAASIGRAIPRRPRQVPTREG